MHLIYNASREGLMENPKGCRDGRLVNEEMVRKGLASAEQYKDRGELKYERRMKSLRPIRTNPTNKPMNEKMSE